MRAPREAAADTEKSRHGIFGTNRALEMVRDDFRADAEMSPVRTEVSGESTLMPLIFSVLGVVEFVKSEGKGVRCLVQPESMIHGWTAE